MEKGARAGFLCRMVLEVGDGDIYGMEVPKVCFGGKTGERACCEGKGREEEEMQTN